MSKKIDFNGFNRVVINEHGEAMSPIRAEQVKISPDIGFLRDDGWSLGAPNNLADTAYKMWVGQWTHFITIGDQQWRPISEYHKSHWMHHE